MARPLEERGYFVHPRDPATPLHVKMSRARGLVPITLEQARLLSAAKRCGAQDRETAGVDHNPHVVSDQPTPEGAVVELPAPPPPPDAEPEPEAQHDYERQFEAPPVVGDWREAIKRMEDDSSAEPAEDFGIGMETYPDDGLELDPMPPELQVSEEMSQVTAPKPQVATGALQAPPSPTALEPPPVPRTIVVAEQKTISDVTWGKAQIRYEVAIQAKNGNAYCRGLLMEPAARRGMSVLDLADEILRDRDELIQRVMSEF